MRRIIVLLLLTVVLFPVTAFSQTRTRRSVSTAQKRRTTATSESDAQRAGAARVAEQIKNLTRFVYVLGGVTKEIQGVDDAARRNEASPAVIETATRSKASVRSSIKTVREGLDKLEIDFRTTPELQRYYIPLVGVAGGAATAEELAANNQFDKAGRSLLNVVNQLTDVLLLMR